jgi:23S rRNA (guanosine2251-2'-O)-methyltransferase
MQRGNQKLHKSVLQNKISNDLFVVGKNSILEIFSSEYNHFESLIVPSNYTSEKIKTIVELFSQKRIPVFCDSSLIDYAEAALGVDSAGVIVLLKKSIEKYLSLRDVKPMIEEMKTCTVVGLYNVEYEQNLGAMIRTSLGLKVDFMLLPNKQQKVFGSTVTKVSMGYNYVLPIVRENFLLTITELKKMGFEIVALDMGGENMVNFRYNPKVCFIFGNEGKGISDTMMKKCDKILSIPIDKSVESLNVSTSLGITLFDRISKLYT